MLTWDWESALWSYDSNFCCFVLLEIFNQFKKFQTKLTFSQKCLIALCEIFEHVPEYSVEWFNYLCSSECTIFDAYFRCILPDENQLKKLIEITKGDREIAEERQEDLLHLGVAILAAFTYVPLNVSPQSQIQKIRVSKVVSAKLLELNNLTFTENWLIFLRHPTSSVNVLKALYSLCMANPSMCLYLAKSEMHMSALCDILSEKIETIPAVLNEVIEIAINTMSTIIIQLFEIPINGDNSLT